MNRELLERIHDLLAQDMLKRLQDGTKVVDKHGEIEKIDITAAELNVIRQFLKDNGVDKLAPKDDPSDAMNRLVSEAEKSLPEALRR